MSEPVSRNSLDLLVTHLMQVWPEHADYVRTSFAGRTPEVTTISRKVAACALRLAGRVEGGLDQLCRDYRFLCQKIVLPEEVYFRRHGRYRLASFEEAERECYANAPFMERYMNGVLISSVIWRNHARAMSDYVLNYLASLPAGSHHLEIGPGHGIFLYFAAMQPMMSSVTGWDVSPTSIERTRLALESMGVLRPVELELRNILALRRSNPHLRFNSIVMSEVLEHLEQPVDALRSARALLQAGGSLWVNVPANSPAPDHIFLVENVEHACELVRGAGFEIVRYAAFPMTGSTLETAIRQKRTVSCIVHARAPF